MKILPFFLIAFGLCWLAFDANLIVSELILRETFRAVNQILDRLPQAIIQPTFRVLWAVLLLGWTVPLILAVRLLRKKRTGI
jgi:hypothetical protein